MVSYEAWGRLKPHQGDVLFFDKEKPAHIFNASESVVAYGMGRSYGDQCLNQQGAICVTQALNRFISFDEQTGVLRCEAGVLLKEINELTIPRGWMLPVTPGTQFVTVGGAIANDVHGKNHHVMGSFGHHVLELSLHRSTGEHIVCSATNHSEWFRATIGGFGLTGVIDEAVLKLRPVKGPWMQTESIAYDSLEAFYQLSDASESQWEYTVSWIDCTSPTHARGIFMRGNHSEATTAWPARIKSPSTVPMTPPISMINRLSLKPFNTLYYHRHRLNRGIRESFYVPFFYPLDNILKWNRIYGPRGFFQYQVAIPHRVRLEAIAEMLKAIASSGQGSFLAVLKTFGEKAGAGLMSFPFHGATLALDFSHQGEATFKLFERLDAIVTEANGRIYLAKDARMSSALFASAYPNLDEFLNYRDPGISSDMSRRLLGS